MTSTIRQALPSAEPAAAAAGATKAEAGAGAPPVYTRVVAIGVAPTAARSLGVTSVTGSPRWKGDAEAAATAANAQGLADYAHHVMGCN